MKTQFLRFVFTLLLGVYANGQSASIMPDSLRVETGNPFRLILKLDGISMRPTDSVDLSPWLPGVSAENLLDSTREWKQSNTSAWEMKLNLIFFDSATLVLPPLMIGQASTIDTLRIEVYPTPVPEGAELAPIKDIIEAPAGTESKPNYLWWILGGLIILGLLAWFFWRARKIAPARYDHQPHLSPSENAQRALDHLQKQVPVYPQRVYYEELSHILRRYYEDRFQIPALEHTTTEIRQALANHAELQADADAAFLILERADLVKFGKDNPPTTLQEELLSKSKRLIRP